MGRKVVALNDKRSPQDLNTVQAGYLGTTPPPGKLPDRGNRVWVDRPEQLLHAANLLKQSDVVAVDAEFTQARSRTQNDPLASSHRLALLQLAIDGHCFVIDALRLNDLSPLCAVVENPNIIILLHGAGADMHVMAERGLNVAHYYDLEATSRSIFGQHESSLAAMMRRAFNTRLDKSLQRTDWARRPLPPAMIAYAARDAEMTLALYYWLRQYYPAMLQIHEYTNEPEPVAAWIEPFLHGTPPIPVEQTVAEAKASGIIVDEAQIVEDCRAALATLKHLLHRSRLLRLIADLSLVQLASEIEPLLQSLTADERSASVRALGRLGVTQADALIRPLLEDPVLDVRKAAQTALRHAKGGKNPREPWAIPAKLTDGTRSWTVGETNQSDEDDWKARLRAILGE